ATGLKRCRREGFLPATARLRFASKQNGRTAHFDLHTFCTRLTLPAHYRGSSPCPRAACALDGAVCVPFPSSGVMAPTNLSEEISPEAYTHTRSFSLPMATVG